MTKLIRLSRVLLFALALVLVMPAATALAQSDSDYTDLLEEADGRLRGYEQMGVVMKDSSTALTYAALIGLTVLAAGLLFKASRRTHLD